MNAKSQDPGRLCSLEVFKQESNGSGSRKISSGFGGRYSFFRAIWGVDRFSAKIPTFGEIQDSDPFGMDHTAAYDVCGVENGRGCLIPQRHRVGALKGIHKNRDLGIRVLSAPARQSCQSSIEGALVKFGKSCETRAERMRSYGCAPSRPVRGGAGFPPALP